MSDDTRAAEEWAGRQISRFLKVESKSSGPSWHSLWNLFHLQYSTDTEKFVMIPTGVDTSIVDVAKKDREAYELARFVASNRLCAGVFLPEALARFAGNCLKGKFKEPKKSSGRSRATNWERDFFIIGLMEDLIEKFAQVPTQNSFRSSNSVAAPSAPKIISRQFVHLNHHEVTVGAVKEVWNTTKKRNAFRKIREMEKENTETTWDQLPYI